MITLTREEAQQVLDALEQWNTPLYKRGTAIKTLRQAIAEVEKQEPVAWHEPGSYSNVTVYKKWAEENGWLPLYSKGV